MPQIIVLAVIQSMLLAGAQVFLKFALARMLPFAWTKEFWFSLLTNWQFALCGILFLSASLLWMYIIKHYPLSTAYPMISLSYVFGMLSAMIFFHEDISLVKWAGIACIMVGCVLISRQA